MSNYFEDAIKTGQPIVPPVPVTPQTQQPNEQGDEWKGLPVRVSGDKIFLLKNGLKRWITTKEVYEKLGFKFGDEVKLDQATFDVIPEGDPIR